MSKLKKYNEFSEKEELLIESCGANSIGSCGGSSIGSSIGSEESEEVERQRNIEIQRKRNRIIDDLTHSCPDCTEKLAKNAKFCQECGHKVPDEIRNYKSK